MPKQLPPVVESFESFRQALLHQGFLEMRGSKTGRAGFMYEVNGLAVEIWTTFLLEEGQAPKKHLGYVLIRQGDQVKYFGRPFSRNKKYFYHLLWYAYIARVRILDRPKCPLCGAPMEIAQVRGILEVVLEARTWQCDKFHSARYRSLNRALPPAALTFLRRELKLRERYRSLLDREKKKLGWPLFLRRRARTGRIVKV